MASVLDNFTAAFQSCQNKLAAFTLQTREQLIILKTEGPNGISVTGHAESKETNIIIQVKSLFSFTSEACLISAGVLRV